MRLLLIELGTLLVAIQVTVGDISDSASYISGNEIDSSPSVMKVFINPGEAYRSDSTEQMSDDGHDEFRRLGDKLEEWKLWEGRSNLSNDGVSTAQKIEAFVAFAIATITAILSNMLTKVVIKLN